MNSLYHFYNSSVNPKYFPSIKITVRRIKPQQLQNFSNRSVHTKAENCSLHNPQRGEGKKTTILRILDCVDGSIHPNGCTVSALVVLLWTGVIHTQSLCPRVGVQLVQDGNTEVSQ